jgi:hypothetical protein
MNPFSEAELAYLTGERPSAEFVDLIWGCWERCLSQNTRALRSTLASASTA